MASYASDQWLSPESMETSVAIATGTSFIGLATVTHGSNVTLNASSAFIGLATVVMGVSRVTVSGADVTNDVMKVEGQFSYGAITSVSTVAIKASAGFFHSFNVGMPSCPTTIFFDSATGTGTKIHQIAAGYPQGTHLMDVKFTNGLSIDSVQSGSAAVVPQILVAWR